MAVFSLSIHADYRCRHSGACCTADWDVPVEVPLYRTLDDALKSGRLTAAASSERGRAPLVVENDLPRGAAAIVARTSTGDCVFYHRLSGLCVIHRDVGETLLPATCRHFPRLAVRDSRGTFISLTHYCPTAAAALFRDMPVEIVESPPAFPDAEYQGLVITDEDWPPLLRREVLADADSYAAWERHMVRRCVDPVLSAESVIATLEGDARLVRAISPVTGESIVRAIAGLPESGITTDVPSTLDGSLEHLADVIAAVPEEWRPEPDTHRLGSVYASSVRPLWSHWNPTLKRYLAAKAFASWTAYQGRGFLTIVRGLDAALALVRVEAARQCRDSQRSLDAQLLQEAVRQADFVLNHLAAGDELAERWSKVEA